MGTTKFYVKGMTCACSAARVEKAAASVSGVKNVSVNLFTNSMTAEFSDPKLTEDIAFAVKKAGYYAVPQDDHAEGKAASVLKESKTSSIAWRLTISLIFLIPLIYISMGHIVLGLPLPQPVASNFLVLTFSEMLLCILIMIINQRFFISGFLSFIHKAPNVDTLISMGSGACFIYSAVAIFQTADFDARFLHDLYFDFAAMILILAEMGKLLESYSKGRIADVMKSLMDTVPETACVIRKGRKEIIPADQIRSGDIFILKPGERIPADGIVIDGSGAVDESVFTGESIPVQKESGSSVKAATLDQDGFLTCAALTGGSDTAFKKILNMAENAAATKVPVSKIADRVSKVFVPVMMILALITCIVWIAAGKGSAFALICGISVLVISSPCALSLAAPAAIMTGCGLGVKNGILFKTAAVLEAAGKTDIMIIDKTGTITEGKPLVTDIVAAEGITDEALLSVAASLEEKSGHPFAKAVMKKVRGEGIRCKEVENFIVLPGYGVRGDIIFAEGRKPELGLGGNAALMKKYGLLTEGFQSKGETFSREGKTPLYFSKGEKLLGIIAVVDVPKSESKDAVSQLEDLGIRVVMLTGENRLTAEAVAKQAGIKLIAADLLPEEKDKIISRLMKYGKTAVIGDAIDDVPAFAEADIGIAAGMGTDVALDAADIVLIKSSLADIPGAVRLSREVLKNIRRNLFWTFCYNIIGIPIAAGILFPFFGIVLNPVIAAAAMSFSSFCVVSNALRLNLFDLYRSGRKDKRDPVCFPEEILCPDKSGSSENEDI